MVVISGSIAYIGGEFTRQEPTWFAGKGLNIIR